MNGQDSTRLSGLVGGLHGVRKGLCSCKAPLTCPPAADSWSPVLTSRLCASVALEMTAVPGGHGEEAGDGPEARRDPSPLPGRGDGGVCRHRLLHPGHGSAAPLSEEVPRPLARPILWPLLEGWGL